MMDEGNRSDVAGETEELVADAVADAMTDPEFLRQVVSEGEVMRGAARAFLKFLDGILGAVRGRNTAAYMDDVQAFRDVLADMLRKHQPCFTNPTEKKAASET